MEIWDLYDENRIPTGKTKIRGEDFKKGEYHIVVHLLLFNEKGELLIQHRSENKETWAGYWEVSVSGSVLSGETPSEAIKREAMEEIGFFISEDVLKPDITLSFSDGFDDFYIIKTKNMDISKFKIQKEELSEIKWADMDYILNLFSKEIFIPRFKPVINFAFSFISEI